MPQINPKKYFFLFDWDNTLADSWGIIHDAMMFVFDSLQMPRQWHDIATTKQTGQGALRSYFPQMFGERAGLATEKFYEYYLNHHLDGVKKIAGADELIAFMDKNHYKWGVLSNKRGDLLRREAMKFQWLNPNLAGATPRFIGSRDGLYDKPARGAWHYYHQLNRAIIGDLTPVYIGDMAVDGEFAKNINCPAFIIGDNSIQADKHFADLNELWHFLG